LETGAEKWERQGLLTWDFEALPESVSLTDRLLAYPALAPDKDLQPSPFPHEPASLCLPREGRSTSLDAPSCERSQASQEILTLPSEAYAGARYSGGMDSVEGLLYARLLRNLLRKNVRTKQEFLSHADSAKTVLFRKSKGTQERGGEDSGGL